MSSIEETPAAIAEEHIEEVAGEDDSKAAKAKSMKKQAGTKVKGTQAADDDEEEDEAADKSATDTEPVVEQPAVTSKPSGKTPSEASATTPDKGKPKAAAAAKDKKKQSAKNAKGAVAKGKAKAGGKSKAAPNTGGKSKGAPNTGGKSKAAFVMKKPGLQTKRPSAAVFDSDDDEKPDAVVDNTKPSPKKKKTGKNIGDFAVGLSSLPRKKVVDADLPDEDDDDEEEDDEGEEEEETERDECVASTEQDKLDRSKANKFNDMYKDGQLPDWARAYYETCMHIFI